MGSSANRSYRRVAGTILLSAVAACFSGTVSAAKPAAAVYADVHITFGGETSVFSGPLDAFSQAQNGGRLAFQLTNLGTSDFDAVPQIDTGLLEPNGNHWEVISKVGNRSYSFVGTCASLTFSAIESGSVVRHVFLNCSDMNFTASP